MTLPAALRPFETRSFRYQWPADLCAAWALEMESLILGWYILVETGSVVWLTAFASLQFIGTLISPMTGALADQHGLRRVLTVMRLWYAGFAALVLLCCVTGQLRPLAVLVIAGLSGLLKPSDIGMRSALVGETVPVAQLTAAMGISRTTMDSAKVGGALAGTGVVAFFGMTPAYVAITLIYLAGALLTSRIEGGGRRPAVSAEGGHRIASPWRDLREGLSYVWNTPRLLAGMALAALVNLTVYPLSIGLLPYVVREVFGLEQQSLGHFVASFAVGALAGSLAVSVFGQRLRAGWTMLGACVLWHLCLLAFVASPVPGWAMFWLMGAGFLQSLSMLSLSLTLLRTSEPRFRGRIMGVRMLAIYPLPLGLMLSGQLIPHWGYAGTQTLILCAGLALTAAIALVWRRDLLARSAPANQG